ncbi:MAG TPA: 2OG-Fe(II) oxygenase [Steroidobacteraceae bacterium]|jgi:hypothetical protein|nr:2OG-Fe(II) oxygenase [Steroidobacteraceae bacterium]
MPAVETTESAAAVEAIAAVAALEPRALQDSLDRDGFAVTAPMVDVATCGQLAGLYTAAEGMFRSTVTMARHGFGSGEYKYFARPLPGLVEALRRAMYARLAPIANAWESRLGRAADWPADHDSVVARCADAGQTRPTPLLLRYGPGDYNCLHQDLYGAIHFPLQAILLLDRPGIDFDGGELILVEQRPRRQSRPMVLPLTQGAFAIIPVRERPVQGIRGPARVQVRHGVSQLHRGFRRTLGLIFHDAA